MPDISAVYVDTSALIKWFIEEKNSSLVDTFFEQKLNYSISDLVILEFECTLRRIQRSGKITESYRLKAMQTLAEQIQDQWFEKVNLSNQNFKNAKHLIEQVSPLALRSLDALHLAIIQSHGITWLATSDTEMGDAAKKLGLNVVQFDK